jgi:hypothetical protein
LLPLARIEDQAMHASSTTLYLHCISVDKSKVLYTINGPSRVRRQLSTETAT